MLLCCYLLFQYISTFLEGKVMEKDDEVLRKTREDDEK